MSRFNYLWLFIVLSFIRIPGLFSGELVIPDKLTQSWVADKPAKIFSGRELFNHINGAAELFLEFGFEKLIVYNYRNENVTLDLELYKMQNTTAALGIYLSKTDLESPLSEISARNTANQYQLVIVKGSYFIFVNNFSGKKELLPLMINLGEKIVDQIKETEVVDLFLYLPKEDMLKESMFIFRGPIGLQPIFIFGKGDVLLQKGQIFGVGANYGLLSEKYTSRLVIPYPDSQQAIEAFQHLRTNFNPYNEILNTDDSYLIFKDFNKDFGILRVEENKILIEIHLPTKPE